MDKFEDDMLLIASALKTYDIITKGKSYEAFQRVLTQFLLSTETDPEEEDNRLHIQYDFNSIIHTCNLNFYIVVRDDKGIIKIADEMRFNDLFEIVGEK